MLTSILRFLRLPMSLVPVLAMVAGLVQSRHGAPAGEHDWLAILAMVCLALGIFGDNGYHDRLIDAQKGQPFAKNHQRLARWLSLALYLASMVLGAFLGPTVALAFTVFVAASMIYSAWAVKIPGLKNLMAAGVSASLLILGGLVASQITRLNLVSAMAVFFVITAMEIIKDVEDITVDRGWRTTLPMIWPKRWLNGAVLVLIISGLLSAWTVRVPTAWFFLPFGLAAACVILAAVAFWRFSGALARRWMYAGLWFGVVALTAAAWT